MANTLEQLTREMVEQIGGICYGEVVLRVFIRAGIPIRGELEKKESISMISKQ